MLIMRNSIRLTTALVLSLLSSLATAQTATNIVCTSCVGPTDIATNAVTASEIAANAVTTEEIADGTVRAVDIANANVTSAKIANGTVALVDLSPALQASLGAPLVALTQRRYLVRAHFAGASCPSYTYPCLSQLWLRRRGWCPQFWRACCVLVEGIGAVALCYIDHTFDPNLPAPLARIGR